MTSARDVERLIERRGELHAKVNRSRLSAFTWAAMLIFVILLMDGWLGWLSLACGLLNLFSSIEDMRNRSQELCKLDATLRRTELEFIHESSRQVAVIFPVPAPPPEAPRLPPAGSGLSQAPPEEPSLSARIEPSSPLDSDPRLPALRRHRLNAFGTRWGGFLNLVRAATGIAALVAGFVYFVLR